MTEFEVHDDERAPIRQRARALFEKRAPGTNRPEYIPLTGIRTKFSTLKYDYGHAKLCTPG